MVKKNDYHTDKALEFLELNSNVEAYLGDWKTPFPDESGWWKGDYIISYLSRWIIPQNVIERATVAAINFHPGPPEYPGVGCVNWALYENAVEFGVTCHHLAHPVDSGKLVQVRKFQVYQKDNVSTLLDRTHDYLLTLFYDIMGYVFGGEPLPMFWGVWSKDKRTRKDLNALADINDSMSDEEIERRERACVYGDFGLTYRGRKWLK